jgi:tetratricopeptide (TPR) repeat protein
MDSWFVKLGLASVVLVLVLACVMVPRFTAANPQSADMLAQVMGGTADVAADQAYQEADVYFHAGTGIKCQHEGRAADHRDDDHDVPAQSEADLPLQSWVRMMQSSTAPQIHRHLSDADSKEMLPWFVVSTRLNPHMVEAWSTGVYWFYRSGQVREAERFVSEGISKNPTDYRLYFDRGALYYHQREWDKSVSDLETAKKLWKDLNEDSPYDRAAINRYLGYARSRRTVGSEQ